MLPGHVFTIEPAIVEGEDGYGTLWPDEWTMATRVSYEKKCACSRGCFPDAPSAPPPHPQSGARSAQFEHTVLITETGVDILTSRPKDRIIG